MDGPTLDLVGSSQDIAVLAERAARHDATAVARVVGVGDVLALFVTTPFDCLGMRAARLSRPLDGIDVVVEAVGLAARARTAGPHPQLVLPPPVPPMRWTFGLPPRTGWTGDDSLSTEQVRARVVADTQEFRTRAAELPEAGSAAVLEGIAADVWGRPLIEDFPARLAHAADYLGFLGAADDAAEAVSVRRAGSWRRLSATRGSAMTRVLDPLGLFAT